MQAGKTYTAFPSSSQLYHGRRACLWAVEDTALLQAKAENQAPLVPDNWLDCYLTSMAPINLPCSLKPLIITAPFLKMQALHPKIALLLIVGMKNFLRGHEVTVVYDFLLQDLDLPGTLGGMVAGT